MNDDVLKCDSLDWCFLKLLLKLVFFSLTVTLPADGAGVSSQPNYSEPDTICSPGPPPTCTTLLKGGKNEPNLVPELRLMFVEISRDFLFFFFSFFFFFRKKKFLFGMSSGYSAAAFSCSFSPSFSESRQCFVLQLSQQLQERTCGFNTSSLTVCCAKHHS